MWEGDPGVPAYHWDRWGQWRRGFLGSQGCGGGRNDHGDAGGCSLGGSVGHEARLWSWPGCDRCKLPVGTLKGTEYMHTHKLQVSVIIALVLLPTPFCTTLGDTAVEGTRIERGPVRLACCPWSSLQLLLLNQVSAGGMFFTVATRMIRFSRQQPAVVVVISTNFSMR